MEYIPEDEISRQEFDEMVLRRAGSKALERVMIFEKDPDKVSVASFWYAFYEMQAKKDLSN